MRRIIAALAAAALLVASVPAYADGGKHRGGHAKYGAQHGYKHYKHDGGRRHFKFKHRDRQRHLYKFKHRDRHRHHYSYKRHDRRYYRYGGHYGHKHKHYRRRGHYALGALAGGIAIGTFLSQPRYGYSSTTYVYDSPPTTLGNCVQTTGTSYVNGRIAEYAGTMCYDRYNRPYVVKGSERFIRYLN